MIPALGYPSRTAAALALRARGLKTGEIARQIGAPSKSVSTLLRRAAVGDRRGAPRFRDVLSEDAERRLAPHARRLGLTTPYFAGLLLDALADQPATMKALLIDEEGGA